MAEIDEHLKQAKEAKEQVDAIMQQLGGLSGALDLAQKMTPKYNIPVVIEGTTCNASVGIDETAIMICFTNKEECRKVFDILRTNKHTVLKEVK